MDVVVIMDRACIMNVYWTLLRTQQSSENVIPIQYYLEKDNFNVF